MSNAQNTKIDRPDQNSMIDKKVMASYFANSDLPSARVVVIGMPLDRSSSFIPGTRFGPEVGRMGTANIETFSPYQLKDANDISIHDAGDLLFTFETPLSPIDLIRETTRNIYRSSKRQLAVGGEHSITPAIVGEIVNFFPELCVIQFDAHSDLRDEYLGDKYSHATAMRRVLELIPRENLFQIGIRSFYQPEEMTAPNIYPFEVLTPTKAVRERIGNRPIYITLDIDVLDPGVMPEVQTPQPGGCSYRELINALMVLKGTNCVGADLVEFCPRGLAPSAGAATVAELVRELILLFNFTPQKQI